MHPYSIDFIYSELTDNFDINSVDANLVERDGIFEIDRFMKDLEKLYNAVRFYVALEGILFAEDDVAYKNIVIQKNVRRLVMQENRKPIVIEKLLKKLTKNKKRSKNQKNPAQVRINVHYSL